MGDSGHEDHAACGMVRDAHARPASRRMRRLERRRHDHVFIDDLKP
jgi:hypothetical protein